MMSLANPNKPGRIYQIDLLRFIAAMAVVLYHYLFRGYAQGSYTTLAIPELAPFAKYGYLGVDLFFIISGFVIAMSIRSNSISKFWISRVTRLYPSYWLGVALTSAVIVFFGAPVFSVTWTQVLWNLTMFQNYVGIKSVDGVYWSLFVEMKFYLFIITGYLLANRFIKIQLLQWTFAWLLLTIGYAIWRNLYVFAILNYFFILEWSAYFIAGMVLYFIYSKGKSMPLLLMYFTCWIVSIYNAYYLSIRLEKFFQTEFSPLIIASLISLFFAVLLLIAMGKLQAINSPKWIKYGLLTYPLYLIHENIGFIIFNQFNHAVNPYVLVGSLMAIMLLLSNWISRYYEPKMANIVKKALERFMSLTQKKEVNSD